ncbi:MAG: sulfotransferase, partial [Spirochaetota bacterium]|nr:sulfotransferase [Spirochaetota bacterium]
MFFILSTGRSGTTTIARSLNTIDGLYAVHEPAPELIRESSAYHYGKMTQEEIAKILTDTRKPLVDGSAYCESNQCLSLMIPALREVFPEARYVWLIRNAMDVVASTMQKQWYTGHSENNDNYENCSEIEKDWIDGRIRGDLCGEMSPEEWENMSRFAKCCWYWSYVNRVIKRELSGLGQSKHYVLLLEDIDEEYRKLVS